MKKLIYFFAFLLMYFGTYAQETESDSGFVSKRGVEILPEAGDFAIGVNAVPFFNYVGNMFNNSVGNTVSFNFLNATNTIYGKYFLNEHSAIRVSFRFGNTTHIDNEYIIKDQQIPDPEVLVNDAEKTVTCNSAFKLGFEKSRGKGRVHGIYGAEVGFYTVNIDKTYTYGNVMSATNSNPSTTNFGTNITANGRATQELSGRTIGLGIDGFVGVEYFFAPKISIGGEFTWGFDFYNSKEGTAIEESWDFTNNVLKTSNIKTAGDKGFGFDTGNMGGAIYLLFHF